MKQIRWAPVMAALAAPIVATSTVSAQAKTSPPDIPANLKATRAALDSIRIQSLPFANGYFSTLGCVDYPKGGGGEGQMAYKPGGMKLDGPMEGHAPVLPVELSHWDLHVWLWKDNPNGLMHSTNSNVKCPDGPYTFHELATKMVHK